SAGILGNLSDQDYFQQVIKTRKPVISQPRASKATGEISIYFAAPIIDVNTGKISGVVRSQMPTQALDKIFKDREQAIAANTDSLREVDYHLVGSDGRFFVAYVKDHIGKDVSTHFANFARLQSSTQVSSAVDIHLNGNVEQLVTHAPVTQQPGVADLNWSIVLAQNTSIAFAAERRLLLNLLIGTGLSALVVSAVAALLANRATRPILRASDAVAKLGHGELNTRVAVEGEDELAALGLNINLMADQLQNFLRQQETETKRTQLLANITASRARESQDLEAVFNQALQAARETLNADRLVIYRFKPDWSGYISAEAVVPGWPQALAEEIGDPCIPEPLLEAYRKGRTVPTNNVFEMDYAPEHGQLLEHLEVKANLVTPILEQGQLFGLLVAHHCSGPHSWQQSEIDFLKQLALQLGQPLDRIAFIEQVEQARQQAEKLAEDQILQKEMLQMQLVELLSDIQGAASGDLTVRAEVSAGAIGTVADFFNSIVESLRQIVTQVKTAALQVNSSLGQNQGAVRQLAEGALKQAQETIQTLDSVEQMTQSIQAVANSAQKAAEVARTA
ncbi:MAG TPA: GAF domain-containing protein, partial [Candidatus Caenarcaniphilales bacterium]